MVDLSKAKHGDTVKFRCGGEAVISAISPSSSDPSDAAFYRVQFVGSNADYTFWYGGSLSNSGPCSAEGILSITEVIPAPVAFDWSTAKWGMAFRTAVGSIRHFIGYTVDRKAAVFEVKDDEGYEVIVAWTEHLTRSPEHDIKEVE